MVMYYCHMVMYGHYIGDKGVDTLLVLKGMANVRVLL